MKRWILPCMTALARYWECFEGERMFFIIGISTEKDTKSFSQTFVCPVCGKYGGYRIFVTYTALTILWRVPVAGQFMNLVVNRGNESSVESRHRSGMRILSAGPTWGLVAAIGIVIIKSADTVAMKRIRIFNTALNVAGNLRIGK